VGLIAKVLSYTRVADRFGAKLSDVKYDPGGGANETGEHFQAANQDAVPLLGDYLLTVSVQRTGGEVVVGFIDPKQEQTAKQGEYRAYARNDDGAQVVQAHLKKDGTAVIDNENGLVALKPNGEIEIRNDTATHIIHPSGAIRGSNPSGFFELQDDGTVNINGATIDPAGNINTPTDVTSGGTVSAPTVVGSSNVTAAGKELAGHDHPAGSPPGNTGPNN
jgi:hypothetical protein